MEKSETYTEINPFTQELETRDLYTGELIIAATYEQRQYTIEMGEAVCNLVRSGKTLNTIAKIVGMPPLFVLYNWRNGNPEFKRKLKNAKKDRAEYFHDRAADLLEDATELEKDEVAANKLAIDGFLKLAEKGNPDEYNPRPNLLQNMNTPAMIVINTGISREPITVEMNNEKICIGGQPENRVGGIPQDVECSSGDSKEGSSKASAKIKEENKEEI